MKYTTEEIAYQAIANFHRSNVELSFLKGSVAMCLANNGEIELYLKNSVIAMKFIKQKRAQMVNALFALGRVTEIQGHTLVISGTSNVLASALSIWNGLSDEVLYDIMNIRFPTSAWDSQREYIRSKDLNPNENYSLSVSEEDAKSSSLTLHILATDKVIFKNIQDHYGNFAISSTIGNTLPTQYSPPKVGKTISLILFNL